MASFSNRECVQALIWQEGKLSILDQRKLPESIDYIQYDNALAVADAIKTMQVRGAPAIGIAAAYAMALSVQQHYSNENKDWLASVEADRKVLAEARPTAVNLSWALNLMHDYLLECKTNPVNAMIEKARLVHQQDIDANKKMGELGADIIGHAKGILTHCNAGALATGGYGTALGVVRSVVKRNEQCAIFAGETRPWLQGARLTVWELAQEGIASTLIADSAAAMLMANGQVDWLVVGADRIAANGDVANKIGTYSLAILAKHHGVKVMVVAPSSTLDFTMVSGDDIEIEQREVTEFLPSCYQQEDSLVTAWNPVFDVTPHDLIDVIVTERGAAFHPFEIGIEDLNEYA